MQAEVFMTYCSGPKLKDTQRQILYGTILGGSSIIKPEKGKNAYLAMRDNDVLWLSYKIEILKDFFKIDDNTIRKDKNTFRCFSMSYPIFNDIYEIFYPEYIKQVTRELLEVLTDDAWMAWFVDAGKKTKTKVVLRTHKFGEEGTKLIADYFNSLECECEALQPKKHWEICFTNKGAYEFLSVVYPKIPDFLLKNYE